MGVAVFTNESVCPTEWKPEASAGKRTQAEMPFLAQVATMHLLEYAVLIKTSFSGAMTAALNHSGHNDFEIADRIPISHSYMSKFIRGLGQAWAKRVIKFMRETQSLAPLQVIAHEMGCDLVVRTSQEARIRALEQQLAKERGLAA